ncbi:hypothetical protein BH20ACT19_BH20ACT19_04640 [soil metagenome]
MTEQPEDRETISDEPSSRDLMAAEQEEAAAAEAAGIGGPDPQPEADPEDRAVLEGGGGEAEGFEQAEDELVRAASHEDASVSPAADTFAPEQESDRSTAVYGEADEVDPTEVTSDPREDEGDPGSGPGLASDR